MPPCRREDLGDDRLRVEAEKIQHCTSLIEIGYGSAPASATPPTYYELEQGKQVQIEPDPKLLRGQGRAELGDSLRHVVHCTPEADVVGVQDSDPLGIGNRGKLVDEAFVFRVAN
jgi:hypothetical protein